MTKKVLSLFAASTLVFMSACASTARGSDASRLAAYSPYLQPAVKQIKYFQTRNWEKITDNHMVLETKPNEQFLLTLDGPCLQLSTGNPSLVIDSHMSGVLFAGSDRIGTLNSDFRCLIREIRPIDVAAMRAAKQAS